MRVGLGDAAGGKRSVVLRADNQQQSGVTGVEHKGGDSGRSAEAKQMAWE